MTPPDKPHTENGEIIGPKPESTLAPRNLLQATLPHSKRAGNDLVLHNGDMTVSLHSRKGLPSGTYPRLILLWMTDEAHKRKNMPIDEARTLTLGNSLSEFMQAVGVTNQTGGRNGTITAVKEQLSKLLSTTIGIDWKVDDGTHTGEKSRDALVSEERQIWWNVDDQQDSLLPSYVVLSRNFFEELVTNPVPISVPILRALKQSAMSLDLYCWLTYRYSYLKTPTAVSWEQLQEQIGASYPRDSQGRRNFKKRVIDALDKVRAAYPEAKFKIGEDSLLLFKSPTSVSQSKRFRALQKGN